jgi:hypothetical protein
MSVLIMISGFAMLSTGLLARFGRFRRWYVIGMRAMWGEVARYGAIPLGVSLIVSGVVISDTLPEEVERIGGWIVATMFLVTMVLGAWRPRWLQPRWLLWLKDNYPDQMEALLEDARRDSWTWQERVSTQPGLEEWAKEVAGEAVDEPPQVIHETWKERWRRKKQERAVRSVVKSFESGRSFTQLEVSRLCPNANRSEITSGLEDLHIRGEIERVGNSIFEKWRRV